MKILLYFIVLFSLPHVNWIPYKLGISPEQIPLGVGNWTLLAAALIFFFGRHNYKAVNYLKSYNYFILLVLFGVVVAVMTGYEDIDFVMTAFKRQISLMLLFYLPLSTISDEEEFRKIFIVCLIIHLMVGVEVFRSGMLVGSNFNDSKRGSGPFSLGWEGSDIAGGYLCQVIMFFAAILYSSELSVKIRCLSAFCCFVLLLGVLSTYARGAIIAMVIGLLMLIVSKGLSLRSVFIVFITASLLFSYLPESVTSRFDKTTSETGQLDVTVTGRFYFYESALKIIVENPLGVGTGQVRAAMQRYTSRYVDPHNGILYTACEYGIVGLIIFLTMLFQCMRGAFAIIKSDSMPIIYKVYARGMIGFITALFFCNMSYANFYKDTVLGTAVIHIGLLAFILHHLHDAQNQAITGAT